MKLVRCRTTLRAALVACAVALVLASPASADIVYLTDGTVVEGEVTDLGDSIKVRKTSGITVVYKKYQVRRIVKQVSKAEEYRTRKEAVSEDDAKGFLELARWCRGKGLDTEAEAAFRSALSIASPVYREAKREFADFLEKAKRLKESLTLYDELGPAAAVEAGAIRAQLDARRAGVYSRAKVLLSEQQLSEAVEALEQAFRFTPPGGTALPGAVTEEEVVAKLAEARRRLAESMSGARVSLTGCKACGAGGTGQCRPCGGRGKTLRDVMVMTRSGPMMQKKLLPCDACRGLGRRRCSSCSGVSVVIEDLQPTMRGTVRSLADCAFGATAGRAKTALGRIDRWVMGHPLPFGEGKPGYRASGGLRDALKDVPATSADVRALESVWRNSGVEARANFLCCYGLELAKRISTLPHSALTDDVLKTATAPATAEERRATLVSAFPGDYSGQVFRVPGIWKGARPDAEGAPRMEIDIEAGGPHSLRPFVWKPEAKQLHERAGQALSLVGLKSRASIYPYEELQGAILKRRAGDRVDLAGRFYYDAKPSPRWGFEVWYVALRPDEDMEKAVRLLSRKVTFRFSGTPLDAAAEMLGELAGVGIELAVPRGVGMRVTARVRKVPLGRALGELLQPLRLEWAYEGPGAGQAPGAKGRVKVVERASARDRERTQAIVKLLPRADAPRR